MCLERIMMIMTYGAACGETFELLLADEGSLHDDLDAMEAGPVVEGQENDFFLSTNCSNPAF